MPVEGDSGARFLAGCHSPSCLVAEKRDIVRPVSAGRRAIFTISNRPFHYQSLAGLMRAMPVKRVGDASLEGCRPPSCPAAKESSSFLWAATPFLTTLAALDNVQYSIPPQECDVTSCWRLHANVTNLRNFKYPFRQTIYIVIHHIVAQPHPQYIHESPHACI